MKFVKVICSSLTGEDFTRDVNNLMIKNLFGNEEITYHFCDKDIKFPGCIMDDTVKYDLIWFAGCNVIYCLFQ